MDSEKKNNNKICSMMANVEAEPEQITRQLQVSHNSLPFLKI